MNWLNTSSGSRLFGDYLKKFEGTQSKKVYKSVISKFFNWFDGSIEAINDHVLNRYKKSFGAGANPKTVKHRFVILKGFLDFASERIGIESPIGKERGDMVRFSSVNYTESESFRNMFDRWQQTALIEENTRKSYGNHVLNAFRFWDKEVKLITLDDLIDYHQTLMKEVSEGKRKMSCVWGRFMAIKSFLNDYSRRDKSFKNPMPNYKAIPNLTPPAKRTDLTDAFSEAELKIILEFLKNLKTLRGIRDYAMFSMMLHLALRINEVCRFRISDIRYRNNETWGIVITKRKGRLGNKPDTQFELTPEVFEPIERWMKESGFDFTPQSFVFLPVRFIKGYGYQVDLDATNKNKPLTTRIMQRHFSEYLKMIEIETQGRKLRPHSLRDTQTTRLTEAGVHPLHIAKFLGHSSTAQLGIYSKYDPVKHNPLKKLG